MTRDRMLVPVNQIELKRMYQIYHIHALVYWIFFLSSNKHKSSCPFFKKQQNRKKTKELANALAAKDKGLSRCSHFCKRSFLGVFAARSGNRTISSVLYCRLLVIALFRVLDLTFNVTWNVHLPLSTLINRNTTKWDENCFVTLCFSGQK